jgi:hypothetical protein
MDNLQPDEIDKKREDMNSTPEDKATTIGTSILNLLKMSAVHIRNIFLYFILGVIVLFYAKLGTSNIIPTEPDCIPENTECLINIFSTWTGQSMKFFFDADAPANKKYMFLDMFRKNRKSSNSFIVRYMTDIMEGLLLLNYGSFNKLFKFFDSMFYEWAIILFGPIILGFFTIGLSIVDFGYLIYLVVTGLAWSFKKVMNPKEKATKIWRSLDSSEDGTSSYIWAIMKFWVLVLFGTIAIWVSGYLLIPFAINVCLIGFLMYKCKMADTADYSDRSKFPPKSFGGILIEAFKFFKSPLMALVGAVITMNAYFSLGVPALIVSSLVLILIAFDIISIDLFKPVVFTNLSDISYENTCEPKDGDTPSCNAQQGGFQQGGGRRSNVGVDWESWVDSFTGKSHNKLMKQIKSLHKKIHA